MDADEYLAEQARKEAAEAVPTLFSMEMGKRELMPNQIKVKNKVIVTFKDGVVRNPKARVLRSNGSEVWGYVPEIPELKAQGFSEGDVFLEVGNLRSGLLHDIRGHGEEIQAMYPDMPFYEAYELFNDELFAKLGSMSGHYSGRGKVKRLEADSKLYDKGDERKKKRVALDLKANESGKYYLIHTAFETYSQKPFTGVKGKDGLTCL